MKIVDRRRVGRAAALGQGLGLLGCLFLAASLRAAEPSTPSTASSDVAATPTAAAREDEKPDPKTEPVAGPEKTTRLGVEEVEKMVQAGVSKEVLKTYLENARVTRLLTPDELISLKEHAVPDDVTMVLLKRAGESRAQAQAAAAVPAGSRGLAAPLDPDSYDFWWAHYGYPRALASSSRILSSAPPYPAYPNVDPHAGWLNGRAFYPYHAYRARYVTARPTGLGGVVERPFGGRPH